MKLIVMITIYSATFILGIASLYGPLKRAVNPDGTHKARVPIPMALIAVAVSFPIVGALVPDGPVCWFFQKWGNIFLGYIMYFLGLLVIIRFIVWIYKSFTDLIQNDRWAPERSHSLQLVTILLAVTLAINVLGSLHAHDVKVKNYEIPKEALGQTEPLRIVLIADLHIGVNSTPGLYEEMVDRINEQDADLVVVAGDIVTSSFNAMRDPDAYASIMSRMKATYGTYAVYGNHDVDEPLLGGFPYIDPDDALRNPEMPGFIEDCGWKLLTDEVVRIPELNNLVIAGRRDETRPGEGLRSRASLNELLKDVDKDEYVILLQHEPSELRYLENAGVDLSLSGHTHDGQIFPGNVFCRLTLDQSYGLKHWGDALAVVTSGVGFYGPPIRFGTDSEIVVIDLI